MRVAVIGAGPAGLAFADRLKSLTPEANIEIFEKSDYIGGISKTVVFKGNRIDIGGHRFFSKSDEVMSWWTNKFPIDSSEKNDEHLISYRNSLRNIQGFKTIDSESQATDRVLLIRKRKSRILFSGKMYDYPLKFNLKTISNIGFIQLISVSSSYLTSKFNRSDPANLEEFIISRFGRKLYSMFFESYTEKVWGRHPLEISPEWGVQRIKGLSIRKLLLDIFQKSIAKITDNSSTEISQKNTETSLIERFLYPKLGPGQMWEEVSKDLQKQGVSISMNQEVIGLRFSNQSQKVDSLSVEDKDGNIKTSKFDYIVSTMPIKDLVNKSTKEDGRNPFADDLVKIASDLPYRDFITVGILLDSLSGPDNEELDDTWIYVQEPNVKVGRIQIFNNWSPYLVKDPNKYWIGLEYFCNEGDSLWNLSNKEMIELAQDEIIKLKLSKKEHFCEATVLREKKTYPAYFDSYQEFDKLIECFNQTNNLFLIGRNGMHKYNNQDHSMLSGFRAAELISNNQLSVEDKSELWAINAEQEYHEEKNSK